MKEKYKDVDLAPLFRTILGLKDEDECYRFFDDICTVQELKAIAQRLQVAKMLDENHVYNDIVAKTGASTATISRVNRSLHYGSNGYRLVFDRELKEAQQEKQEDK